MNQEELEKLPDYIRCEVDRTKLRFNGIGPRVHDKPNEIWPRDTLIYKDESRKILYTELRNSINGDQLVKVEEVLKYLIEGLRKANIKELFNKCCPKGCGRPKNPKPDSYVVHESLDDYTTHYQIISLIHQTIRSINIFKPRSSPDFLNFLFGSHRNYDIFKQHVRLLVIGNKQLRTIRIGQVVSFGRMSMDLDKVLWLQGLAINIRYRIFIQMVYFIFRFIAELVRRYFYITISNPYFDRLFYYRYDTWQALKYRKIEELRAHGVLESFSFDSVNTITANTISKMKFYLKKDDLRLICTQSRPKGSDVKYMQLLATLRYVLDKSPNNEKFSLNKLLDSLKFFRKKMVGEGKKIFIVRADIKNCFQSIDQNHLRSLIIDRLCHLMRGDNLKLALVAVLTKARKSVRGITKAHSELRFWTLDPKEVHDSGHFEYVRIIENNVLIDINSRFNQEYLRPHLVNPIVRESRQSKNAYILTKGIRQGSSFSPILCSIYIQAAFNKHLQQFLTSKTCKILRYVDDVLFLSTHIDEAQAFMHKMLIGFPDFNLKMNINKLKCNFSFEGIEDGICKLDSDNVIFYKQRISTDTLQCRYDYSYEPMELQDTFNVNPLADQEAIRYSIKKFRVDAIHLDCGLNGLDVVLENIFERALFFAHRAATMIICSFEFRDHNSSQDPHFILKLIKTAAKRIFLTIRCSLKRGRIENPLKYFHIRLLIAAAFKVTWNTHKMKHRKVEFDKIEKITSRYMMTHVVSSDSNSILAVNLEPKIKELISKFASSSFTQKVILPSKRTTRRQANQ